LHVTFCIIRFFLKNGGTFNFFLPLSRTLVSFCIGLYFLITWAELLGV
jgi:hypothetical protein